MLKLPPSSTSTRARNFAVKRGSGVAIWLVCILACLEILRFELGLTLGSIFAFSGVRSPRGDFSDESRRRRGRDADIPWRRVAAAPRLGRGCSVETSRGGAVAGTRMFRGDELRRRRGWDAGIPWR